jgi:hypothetical protein
MEEKLPQSSRIEIGVGIVIAALQFWFPNLPVVGSILLPLGLLIILHGALPAVFERSFWDVVNRFYAFVAVLTLGSVFLMAHVVNPG